MKQSKPIQTYLHPFKLIKTYINLSEPFLICPNLSQPFQTILIHEIKLPIPLLISGTCWRAINSLTDQCENNLLGLTLKSACCCSAIGLAWGSPCEKCNPSEDCGGCPPGMAMLDGKKWYFGAIIF